jgi:sugar diacid utilization regulator
MQLHVEHIRALLGSRLLQIWMDEQASQRQVACASLVRSLADATDCRSGELVLLEPAGGERRCTLELIEMLAQRRVAGILIPAGAVDETTRRLLPPQAARYRLAIGLLSEDADLWTITNLANRALATRRAESSASALHSAETLQSLVDTLGRLVGNSVTIETPQHILLAFSTTSTDVDRVREETILRRRGNQRVLAWIEHEGYMAQLRKATRPLRIPANPKLSFSGRVAMRVAAEGETLAIIWVMDTARPLGERDYTIIEEAAEAAAAILLRQREAAQREAELRAEFLDDVVHGRITNPENIRTLALRLGWKIDRLQQALVVAIDDFEHFRLRYAGHTHGHLQRTRERLLELVRLEVLSVDPDAVLGLRSSGVIVLFTAAADAASRRAIAMRLAERIVHRVAAFLAGLTVTVGVGRDFPSFEHMAESFRQAEVAAQLGSSLWGGNRSLHYDDLGVYRVLHTLQEHEGMITPALQQIIDHDRHHHTDYVRTLAAYFACQGRLQAAAAQLGIHRNTLEYRIRRIEELAGICLQEPNNRLALELGIKLLEMKGSK